MKEANKPHEENYRKVRGTEMTGHDHFLMKLLGEALPEKASLRFLKQVNNEIVWTAQTRGEGNRYTL